MIFATVGTSQYPFDRLLKALDEGIRTGQIRQEVFAQSGSSNYQPAFFDYQEFLPFGQMVELIRKADIVVAHAGVGSTLLCLNLGKIPILFPRQHRRHHTELMDNHQLEFARHMEKHRSLLVAYDEEDLINKIDNYEALLGKLPRQKSPPEKCSLINFLRSEIDMTSQVRS